MPEVCGAWTKTEDTFLIENAHKGIKWLIEKTGRTKDSITKRASNLRVSLRSVVFLKPFTKEEDQFIIDNYDSLSWKQISEKLGFKMTTVRKRAKKLGLSGDRDKFIDRARKERDAIWTEEEDTILKNNIHTNYVDIQRLLPKKRSIGAIQVRFYKLGINVYRGGTQWTEKELEIVTNNYELMTFREINNLLPYRSFESVKLKGRSLIKENNVDRSAVIHRALSKYRVNKDYFKILTRENCYWLGFIAADGCVQPRDKGIKFGLSIKDHWHLERFCYCVDFNGPVYTARRRVRLPQGNYGTYEISSLTINAVPEWLEDLEKHANIVPKKSLVLKAPNIYKKDLVFSYICGYIDGDGSITTEEKRDNVKIQIMGTESVMSYIKYWFDKEFVTHKRLASIYKRGNIFAYSLSGKRAKEIISYIKSLGVPKLSRKWDKI